MELSVRYILLDHHSAASKPALCFRGDSYAIGIINEPEEYRTHRLDLEEYENCKLVMYDKEEYPVSRYVALLEANTKPKSDDVKRLLTMYPEPPEDFPTAKRKSKSKATPKPTPKVKALGSSIIKILAGEYNIAASKIRKILRSKGLKAPYEDEKKIRATMSEFGN